MDDLLQALGNLAQQLGPVWDLTFIVAYLIGFMTIVGSLLFLRHKNHMGADRNISGGIVGIFCGIVLLSFPTFLDFASMALFQQSAPTGLSQVTGGSGPDQAFINFSVTIVMLVGLYAVIKGITLIKAHAQSHQQGLLWSATVYLLMGIVCINSKTFMLMLGRSIGGTFQDIVNKLFAG